LASKTLYAVLEEVAGRLGTRPALHQPLPKSGKYQIYTWADYRDIAREIALGLRSIGIGKGDIVTIYSETRAEFYLADMGVMANGSISGALYTSYPMADQVRNLRTAKPKAMIVENEKSLKGLQAVFGDRPLETQWILMTGSAPDALTFNELRARGRKLEADRPGMFDRIRAEYTGDDTGVLYLTSGATGEPKMGLVSQAAGIANVEQGKQVLRLNPDDRALAFLPSAHIAQRIVLEFLTMGMGVAVWFSEGLAKMPAELRTIRPTFFLAPPRVWERVYATVFTEVKKRSGMSQRLFYAAIGVGAEVARLKLAGKPVPPLIGAAWKLFDRLVYRKIRERLGGAMTLACSGAAPLGRELGEFYAAIGMPLIEGYGLTEGGVACLNPIDRPKPGSIGKLLPGVGGRLAEDGELLLSGPTLFSGYFNDPESTAAVLKDGWLYTGDIAEFDDEGYVFITGRKKELIVSSNGKKIYPARIEGLFKSEPVINQMVLIGDKMPYVTALITINTAAAEGLKEMAPFRGKPANEIASSAPVLERVQQAVSRVNKQLAGFEQIRKFRILERDFTIDEGELTPTMKVRRARVLEKNRDTIRELYMGKEVE
jgi:long-chain acyl-CoA synthetase